MNLKKIIQQKDKAKVLIIIALTIIVKKKKKEQFKCPSIGESFTVNYNISM